MGYIDADFPSDRFFTEMTKRALADEPTMRRLGVADLRLGLELRSEDGGTELYGIVLDGYDIDSHGAVDESSFAPEAVLSAPLAAWQELVENIEQNQGADRFHTLNSLVILGDPFSLRSPDAMGSDKFYRFMGTLQAIFDAIGRPLVETAGAV